MDTQIEFFLEATDPDGNTLIESGIHGYNSGLNIWPTGFSCSVDNQLKPATIWNPDQ